MATPFDHVGVEDVPETRRGGHLATGSLVIMEFATCDHFRITESGTRTSINFGTLDKSRLFEKIKIFFTINIY